MKIIRVYINKKITNGFIELDQSQTHYIKNVMRLNIGDNFNIFNENDGEWVVELLELNKKISKVKTLKEIGFNKNVKNLVAHQAKLANKANLLLFVVLKK